MVYQNNVAPNVPVTLFNDNIEIKTTTDNSGNFSLEYKIYQHHSTALDETTGELIHISTSRNDTTYTDASSEEDYIGGRSSTFYYRVYVMNQYGRLGGSNILEVTTPAWDNEENFTI